MSENITPQETSEVPPSPQLAPPVISPSEEPATFGAIDADGNVWVQDGDVVRQVGAYPDGVPEDGLGLYVRRYLELEGQVKLFEDRLPHLGPKDIDLSLNSIREQVKEPSAVGNLQALRDRVESAARAAEERKEQAKAEREAARAEALARRTEIVEAAEAVSAQDPKRTQWKQSGEKLRELLEQWKAAQKAGPKLERASEDQLWKRFSSARTTFDRHRRQFFSEMDAKQSAAKVEKEKLVREAEALQDSTEWGATAGKFRDLMDRWRASGRAGRKVDDALWNRFRSAQQKFFDAKNAANEAVNQEFESNLALKEQILTEAEAILPITDVEAAKAQLRPLQDRWDEVGKVPRSAMQKIEKRMRAVEDAIRAAEDELWHRSNPETKARADGMRGQLEALIEQIDEQIVAAEAKQDEKALKELKEARAARVAWLEQISKVDG